MITIMNPPQVPRSRGPRGPRGPRGRGLQRRPRILRRERRPVQRSTAFRNAPRAPRALSFAPRAAQFRNVPNQPPQKRRRAEPRHPFGFELSTYIGNILANYQLPESVYAIKNNITGFTQDSKPVFKHPHKRWKVLERKGMFVKMEGGEKQIYISGLHTEHTISLYRMAYRILQRLKQQDPVHIGKTTSTQFKQVDITNAVRQKRHASTNILWLNANHCGKMVVLKTTTSLQMQMVYIIEAVIHFLVYKRAPSYIPAIYFVGFNGNSLVVCSEQLHIQSVFTYLGTLRQYTHNPNILAWNMLRSFCLAIRKVQRQASFTHRDCHCSNVYYDARRKIIKFIDFDWSCIRWQGKIISVPRHLYDTTRQQYGVNRSVDICVFLRSMGPALQHCPVFKQKIYDPIMNRYERESKKKLLELMQQGHLEAINIYKMGTEHKTLKSKYAHEYGVANLKINFEYHMGYYTWECMTPNAILAIMDQNKFF